MLGLSTPLETELGLATESGRHLVRSIEALSGARNAHSLRRAWEEIGLSAILFVDSQATVYFREVEDICQDKIRRYQGIVWNQGIATILLVSTKTEIYVFSGQAPPASKDEDWDQSPRLVTTLNRINDALEVKQLIYRIETGLIYEKHPNSFDCEQAIDAHLLKNLGEVAKQLGKIKPKLPLARINSLLGRVIFVCYLVDREIINKNLFATLGADGAGSLVEVFENLSATESIDFLYRLFVKLQEKFNGSLFDENFAAEKKKLTKGHIELLERFLQREELQSGQTSFDFWAYDFNFIPIETISAIYEKFLGAEEQPGRTAAASSQRTSGAYYTPKHLAELVLDTATENGSDASRSALLDKKVLDPACGSGIFLVSIFNRMAEEWQRRNPNAAHETQWDALVEILQTQLFGIDKNETACRITCFSLYLALLDQFDPRDIQALAQQQKLLPTLLLKQGEPADSNSPRTILCRNFFGKDFPQGLQKCDLIVGNPPWIGRKQPPDRDADAWYKENVKQPMPNRQIAHAFMWKCPHHLSDGGQVCLVLPSKVFLNRTDTFQQRWFEHHRVEEVLQLADLRFMLFKTASCPACVVRYRIVADTEKNYSFNYISPQASRSDPRHGAVVITPSDHRRLQSAEVIVSAQRQQAPSLWKMFLRGTPRDIRLLDRLMDYPRLDEMVGKPGSDKRWKVSQGFQPDSSGKAIVSDSQTKPKLPWWDEDHRFVEARKGMNFILLEGDYRNIGDDYTQLRRSPDRRIFQAPLVLVATGFTKVAFADFDVLFRHSLQSISGEQKDRGLLIFLCAVLRSKLAKYFLFHTAANWGTERDVVSQYELLRLPFFPPDHELAPSGTKGIVSQVHSIFTTAKERLSQDTMFPNRENIIKEADEEIEPLIFAYFDCDEFEQNLVHDTCQFIAPSATPGTLNKPILTLEPPTREQRIAYSKTICQVMNEWGQRSPIFISATSIVSPQTGLGIIVLSQTERADPPKDDEADEQLRSTLAELRRNLPEADGIKTYMRGLTVFEGETITLIKPLALRFWTKSAALNDADSLASAILTAPKKPRQ